ncbi:MAG: DUF2459 domain-containing protein [Balneolaceae bacterium]
MKNILNNPSRGVETYFLLLLLPLLSACLGPVTELYPDEEELRPVPVWLVSNDWHVSLVIESARFDEMVPEHDAWPENRYLMFGWGDNRYYPHPDPGFWLLLRAALLPTGSVIHVTGFDIPTEQYFRTATIIRVMISPKGMDKLIDFITGRFRRDENGDLLYAADGLYRSSTFFKSKGVYILPRTSNTWTAKALRQTGAPVTPFYAFTAGNLIRQASGFGEVIRER